MGDFRKAWATACMAAGLAVAEERDGKTVIRPLRYRYDSRRTALRKVVRAGVDAAVAMRISGHRTRAVFDRYNIVSEGDLRQAMTKTSAYVATLPTEIDRDAAPRGGGRPGVRTNTERVQKARRA